MNNWKPDETDFAILNILQQQGRIDVTRIAKRVNKTPGPVHDRIFRLEEAGFIKGYVALLDRAKVGLPVLVVTMVKLEKQAGAQLHAFEQSVARLHQVQFCLQVSGKWDFMLLVAAKTPQDYYTFLMESICGQDNVEHSESFFVLKELKSFGPLVLEKEKIMA